MAAGNGMAIWLEKYRPIKFEDVVGNQGAVNILKSHADDGTFPHLLLSGPPGCGKTTVVHCLARQHLGDHYHDGCIELNASDDRGIDVVREKIKGFAQQKVTLQEGKLKIIILDEADSMTGAAQQAMRRTMEIYSQTTRFALACNISSKLIEPIQSRCAILRFSRISDDELLKRLKWVLEQEGATYDQEGLEALVFSAEGAPLCTAHASRTLCVLCLDGHGLECGVWVLGKVSQSVSFFHYIGDLSST